MARQHGCSWGLTCCGPRIPARWKDSRAQPSRAGEQCSARLGPVALWLLSKTNGPSQAIRSLIPKPWNMPDCSEQLGQPVAICSPVNTSTLSALGNSGIAFGEFPPGGRWGGGGRDKACRLSITPGTVCIKHSKVLSACKMTPLCSLGEGGRAYRLWDSCCGTISPLKTQTFPRRDMYIDARCR